MKKLCFVLGLMLAILMTGCRGNGSADTEELLKNVPSTASFVTVVNLQSLVEKSGCKIKDGEIEVSAEMTAAISKISNSDFRRLCNLFFKNESGIEPSVSIVFADGYNLYNMGLVTNTDRFRSTVEKETGSKFSEQDGISVCGPFALKDNRYWALLKGGSEIQVSEIRRYLSLSENQSFLSSDFSASLRQIRQDVEGWMDLNGVMNVYDVSFQNRAMIKLGMESCFKDAGFASFTFDFKKGEAEMNASILNADGKPAKFLFAMDKVDLATIELLGGNADAVAAMSIPAKLIKQIQDQVSDKPSIIGIYLSALSSIDGTVALALDHKNEAFSAVLTTTGDNTSALMDMLGSMGTVTKEGNRIFVNKGTVSGKTPVKELAEYLKGTGAGVVADAAMAGAGSMIPETAMQTSIMSLQPDGDGIGLRITTRSNNDKENILLTIVKGEAAK